MEWWVWVILVVVVLAAVFVYFRRRSPEESVDESRRWMDRTDGAYGPLRHDDLRKPRE